MGELKGDLSVMPLADLAIWFANRRATGSLTLERGAIKKDFALQDGAVVRAASNDPREYFGQFLVHFGLITEDQLQRAFETQKETNVLLGRILVMIGIVPEQQVIQTLKVKINESMLDAFRWESGKFAFEEAPGDEARPQIDVAVPLFDIHREGVRRATTWDHFNRIFVNQTMLLSVQETRVPLAATLDTLDGRIIALARHGLSIEAISLELHATDYQVAARLYELHKNDVIEPREPSEPLRSFTGDISQVNLSHADRARQTLAIGDFATAFRHVQAAIKSDPGSQELSQLQKQIEAKYREEIQSEIVSREKIPISLSNVDESATKRLSAKQRYLLARIDGKRSVQALIQVSPMHDIEALEILRQMLRDKIIRLM